jgi:DNA helicase-2/ATP-dependent DNA helicase PcrA
VAGRFLRDNVECLGFTSNFIVFSNDSSDATFLLGKAKGDLAILDEEQDANALTSDDGENVETGEEMEPLENGDILQICSRSLNMNMEVGETVIKFFPEYMDRIPYIQKVIEKYRDVKKKNNYMDFDDMLVYFLELLRTPGVGFRFFRIAHHLLVDEYQDVTPLQADIVIEIARRSRSTMVVGDDAQTIYSFRGSSIDCMLGFGGVLRDVVMYYLTKNHRSTPQILSLANASIKHNERQFEKELKSTKPSGMKPLVMKCVDVKNVIDFVIRRVQESHDRGVLYHQQAVLFRNTPMWIADLEFGMISNDIPYVLRAGTRFFDKEHIMSMISFAAILYNQHDELAWTHLLGMLPGMGDKATARMVGILLESRDPVLHFILTDWNTSVELRGKRIQHKSIDAMQKLQDFYKQTVVDARSMSVLPGESMPHPGDFFGAVLDGYGSLLTRITASGSVIKKTDDLMQLVTIAGRYESLSGFMDDIEVSEEALDEENEDEDDPEKKPLVISTIHKAKGLEWESVYIVNVVEGELPDYRSVNPELVSEERRVFYVASTRAKSDLYFVYAKTMMSRDGSYHPATRSRFLDEIENDGVFDDDQSRYIDESNSNDGLSSRCFSSRVDESREERGVSISRKRRRTSRM